jgi:hypothetical protein
VRHIKWLRRILGASLILAVGTLVLWVGYRSGQRRVAARPDGEVRRSANLEVTDLNHEFFDREHRRLNLHADRLVHRTRRIGPLTINPVKEIELHGVRLEFDMDQLGTTRGDDFDNRFLEERILSMIRRAFAELLVHHELGFVSRVSVVGLDVDLLQDGARSAGLHAGRLVLDPLERGFTLQDGVELLSPSGDRLQTREAHWDPDVRGLVVSGAYLLHHDDHARSGTGAAVGFGRGGRIVLQ